MQKRHLLITGLPGTGKTTLIVKVARRLSRFHPAGFYTEEVRERGERRGFRLTSLDGREGILADVSFTGQGTVGRYGVDIKGFEDFLKALKLPSCPSTLVVIDEIGKMECLSREFVALIGQLLSSGRTVVATVARKGEGLIEEVKARGDVQLIEITRANRDGLADEVTRWLEERLPGQG